MLKFRQADLNDFDNMFKIVCEKRKKIVRQSCRKQLKNVVKSCIIYSIWADFQNARTTHSIQHNS